MQTLAPFLERWKQQRKDGLLPPFPEVEPPRRATAQELRRADVPDDAIAALDTLRHEAPVGLAEAFLKQGTTDARFLLLLGKKGTGKTVAAALVMADIIGHVLQRARPSGGEAQRGPPGMFVRATTLSRLSAYDAADKAWFEDMCRTPILVLDDVGTELAGDVFRAHLYELLDRRYSKSRRTVITSNLDKKAFAERYGDRIADRLRERGMAAEFTGESLRERRAK
jgi:DNA replication protein DnaC